MIALFVFVLAGFLAATSLGSHDPEHPFAGNWTISFQAAATATFSFGLVGDAEGLAAMNAIFATGPCEEPSDYYTGTYVERDHSGAIVNSGALAGCTTGDDRSIYAPYLPSTGVCCGFVVASLGPSGETFSGQNYFKPAAVVAKAGSSLVLCFLDPTGGRPFSFSLYNKFSARVKPGACLRRVLRNPTDAKLTMRVYDDRFSGDRVRLAVTILPA